MKSAPIMVTREPRGPLTGTILMTEAIRESSDVSTPVGTGAGMLVLLLDPVAVVCDELSLAHAETLIASAVADKA